MSTKEADLQKTFSMFANEKKLMSVNSAIEALRCAGYVVDDSITQDEESYINFEQYKELAGKASSQMITKEKIEAGFKVFDPQETGYIKASDFKKILMDGEQSMKESDIKDLFEHFKPNEHGMICYNLMIQYLYD